MLLNTEEIPMQAQLEEKTAALCLQHRAVFTQKPARHRKKQCTITGNYSKKCHHGRRETAAAAAAAIKCFGKSIIHPLTSVRCNLDSA